MGKIPFHTGKGKDRILAEYLWIDGTAERAIRSKPKVIEIPEGMVPDEFGEKFEAPVWGFDGSSTEQAPGDKSDCVLRPVRVYYDSVRNKGQEKFPHVLVLNEVELVSGEPHPTNTRVRLRKITGDLEDQKYLFGIEQEFTFFKGDRPLGFPPEGFPERQGKYYCSVGADRCFGRPLVERHYDAMLAAGIQCAGGNVEVMPGQHEYQIGAGDPLRVADDLVVARYLLARLGEDFGISISLAAKPVKGDWNGAGAHTNFSTEAMRQGAIPLEDVIRRMEAVHMAHIDVYGEGIKDRLTGKHETAPWDQFRFGVSDRGGSIRIPWQVAQAGKGYLEDRRPCASIDPYVVCAKIMETVGRTS